MQYCPRSQEHGFIVSFDNRRVEWFRQKQDDDIMEKSTFMQNKYEQVQGGQDSKNIRRNLFYVIRQFGTWKEQTNSDTSRDFLHLISILLLPSLSRALTSSPLIQQPYFFFFNPNSLFQVTKLSYLRLLSRISCRFTESEAFNLQGGKGSGLIIKLLY
ncbi:hypothetical protein L2E82_33154 [Cichorium intybus]|uniref:Uncharacterized protein n=1 Tax=Cichorium intybus TaxID=13427 RepID=A0ACB9BJD9_CICIN|nr:hypothetical protein L2E82_33154 [Cichorium intybus]